MLQISGEGEVARSAPLPPVLPTRGRFMLCSRRERAASRHVTEERALTPFPALFIRRRSSGPTRMTKNIDR